MLKKFMIVSVFAVSALTTVPTTALADEYDECLLKAGCFWTGGDGSNPGAWTCSNPRAYMLCLSPDTGVALNGLTFEPLKD